MKEKEEPELVVQRHPGPSLVETWPSPSWRSFCVPCVPPLLVRRTPEEKGAAVRPPYSTGPQPLPLCSSSLRSCLSRLSYSAVTGA